MNSLLLSFQQEASQWLQPGQKILVAVSGGLDSVVLAALCRKAGYNLALAHCHFGLRGSESDRDAAFVKKLAEDWQMPFYLTHFDTKAHAAEAKLSTQAAARELRYRWFAELKNVEGFDWVLLGHHADDNVETILMQFFRGTGIQGLTGIPEKREGFFLRPLLHFRRRQLLDFAREENLSWVEDSSNATTDYTRNFFRLKVLPLVQEVYPEAAENILRNVARMKKTKALYDLGFEQLRRFLIEQEPGGQPRVSVLKLKPYLNTAFLFEWLYPYGFSEKQLPDIEQLLEAQNGKWVASATHQLIRHNRWLVLAPVAAKAALLVLEETMDRLDFGGGRLSINRYLKEKLVPDSSAATAQLDATKVQFPLVVRPWKAGDYFYPLGMKKKKKLARFFIDQKLGKHQKEQVWVLESNKRIVWVAGLRIDDRFKITPATQHVLEISLNPSTQNNISPR